MKSKNYLKPAVKCAAFVIFITALVAVLTLTAYAQVDKNDKAIIDYTDTPNTGTVSIKLAKSAAPMEARVRIVKNDTTYDYRLKNDGTAEFFPLQMGNGDYSVRVLLGPMPNGQWSVALASSYKLNLKNANAVFLNPSQFINYNSRSKITLKAAELVKTANAKTDLEKVEAIYKFV